MYDVIDFITGFGWCQILWRGRDVRSMRYYTIVALTQNNKARTPADLAPKRCHDDLAELLW